MEASDFLVCPLSKQTLTLVGSDYQAPCGFVYPGGDFRVGIDFTSTWAAEQREYEEFVAEWRRENDTVPGRMEEVDASFDDVYAQISLDGLVLDVAGDVGTVVTQAGIDPRRYVSIDTMRTDLAALGREYPRYAAHYSKARDGLFLQGNAEYLPIRDATFDCVHLRGCLDHFKAPHVALMEAFRVLKPGGRVVIGLTLEGAYQKAVGDITRSSVVNRAYKAGVTKLKEHPRLFTTLGQLKWRIQGVEDHHLFHPTYESLTRLVRSCGFVVEQEVWQKAYHNVLYLAARRTESLVPAVATGAV